MIIYDLGVLLVEDDLTVCNTLRCMLQEMGVTNIYEANDGNHALALLDQRPDNISMTICDWNMAGKTGIELLQEIRVDYPELPFLMVTARADEASVLQAKELCVTGYIRKPFSYDCLQKKISNIVSHMPEHV